MSQTILISEQELATAQTAFVRAWHEQDEMLAQLDVHGVVGTRTRAGLIAALRTLGIGLSDHA